MPDMKIQFHLSSETPFADLMLHPEKVEAVLKAAKKARINFTPPGTANRSPGSHAKSRMSGAR